MKFLAIMAMVVPSYAQQPAAPAPDLEGIIAAERHAASLLAVMERRPLRASAPAPVLERRMLARELEPDAPSSSFGVSLAKPLVEQNEDVRPARVSDANAPPDPQRPVAAMQPAPVTGGGSFKVRVEFEPISEVRLNARQAAELVNARACNDDVNPATMDVERLIMSVGDMRVLTKTQAVWLLSQKRGQDWHVIVPRWGVLGIAIATVASANPWVAAGIPIYQQLMEVITAGAPDITPFVAEMLPDSFTLQAVGQKGACITGSMFVSKEATSAFAVQGGKRGQKKALRSAVR